MAPFSKELLIQDLNRGMEVLSDLLGKLVGYDRVAALTCAPTRNGTSATNPAHVNPVPGITLFEDAFDFAFEGRLRAGDFKDEATEIDVLVAFIRGLNATADCEAADGFDLCVRTVEAAEKRILLHGNLTFTGRGTLINHVSLVDLASLAGLDEKTLRNMTSPNSPARLHTTKIDKRTYVSNSVAIPWLLARGFKPTVVEDFRPERDFKVDAFLSHMDLAEYVRQRRQQLSLSPDDIAKRMGGEQKIPLVLAVEAGTSPGDEESLKRLGAALGVRDVDEFCAAAMDIPDYWFIPFAPKKTENKEAGK